MKRWLLGIAVAIVGCAPQEDEVGLPDETVPEVRSVPVDTGQVADATAMDMRAMMRDSVMRMDSAGGTRGIHTMPPARDADHMFLRMMSDHHEGLVQMAMQAMQRGGTQAVKDDARALHRKQVAERDEMVGVLDRAYDEEHVPTPMAMHRAQADSLAAAPGGEHDEMFYRMVIDHHRQGVMMIDHLLPRLRRPDVREMAERMRAEQEREVQELGAKLNRS